MPKYLDAVAQARRTSTLLLIGMVGSWAVSGYALLTMQSAHHNLTAHVPPDLSTGTSLRVGAGEVPSPNVYQFAFYMWQQLNHWVADGSKDYGAQIYAMQHYVTPSCRAQLIADMTKRNTDGELFRRTRAVMEIPGLGYRPDRVQVLGPSSWQVLLDTQLRETQSGVDVKDTFIRYPIKVVRFDVNREQNPWQLAIDCFGNERPARLEAQAVEVARQQGRAVVAVNPRPSQGPLPNSYVADGGTAPGPAPAASAASPSSSMTPSITPTTLPR